MAASAAIMENIPTRPREGRTQSGSIEGRVMTALLNRGLPLFVLPIRIFRMLDIPKGTPALDNRNPFEVVFGRRRIRGPLERPRVPGIVAGRFPFGHRSQQ